MKTPSQPDFHGLPDFARGKKQTSVLLCTSLYFCVLLCTSLYFSVFLCTSLYFVVLRCTSLYFVVLLCTSRYLYWLMLKVCFQWQKKNVLLVGTEFLTIPNNGTLLLCFWEKNEKKEWYFFRTSLYFSVLLCTSVLQKYEVLLFPPCRFLPCENGC